MLNSKTNLYEIKMPISQDYHILIRNDAIAGKPRIIMTYINSEEEKRIDSIGNGFIKLDRGNRTFTVKKHQIYCYGEVDFKNKDDLSQLDDLKLTNLVDFHGARVPADYDYETHSCYSPIRQYRLTESFNPIAIIEYAHACLNKPKRILIFKA